MGCETEVQLELSCMAKGNNLTIVANMGNSLPCHGEASANCPSDKRLLYNTNVVFDPSGRLIARYHKHHKLQDEPFSRPVTPEVVSFDTPFGRWGLCTGTDILFREIAVNSVQNHSLANIAYLSSWKDAPPLMSSIGVQSAFAKRMGVNLLAANVHRPEKGMYGSGIYTPRGHVVYHYNTTALSEPKLLVAEVDTLERPDPELFIDDDVSETASREELFIDDFDDAARDELITVSGQGYGSLNQKAETDTSGKKKEIHAKKASD
nr:hypothetical protein BaRGS_006574 [Batillaria attramentaria]